MTFETQDMVALDQHPGVDGAVRLMAGGAAFAHRFVFKHKWAPLRDVTFAAGVLFRGQRRPATDDGRSLVRVVAVGAADLAFRHWMMIRELEAAGDLQVTIKTGLGRLSRVDNGAARAAG